MRVIPAIAHMTDDTAMIAVLSTKCHHRYHQQPHHTTRYVCIDIYSVSQKIPPPEDLWQFFQNDWKFFKQILHAYYAFLSTLDYEFLFNYLQL